MHGVYMHAFSMFITGKFRIIKQTVSPQFLPQNSFPVNSTRGRFSPPSCRMPRNDNILFYKGERGLRNTGNRLPTRLLFRKAETPRKKVGEWSSRSLLNKIFWGISMANKWAKLLPVIRLEDAGQIKTQSNRFVMLNLGYHMTTLPVIPW